jgi:hypothetical protein
MLFDLYLQLLGDESLAFRIVGQPQLVTRDKAL